MQVIKIQKVIKILGILVFDIRLLTFAFYPFVIRLTFCIFGPVRVADLRPEVRGEANSRTGNFLFACILVY